MPPVVATVLYCVFIVWLFRLDRDRNSRVSASIVIPIIWFAIGGSRMISLWFTGSGAAMSSSSISEQMEEGSLVDRLLFTGLLSAGLLVLAGRQRKTVEMLRANWVIALFFLYGALTIVWSDYSIVAFKRWSKAVGNLVMVLCVLTEEDPAAAVKHLFARAGFILIPTSVLVIKYFPEYGRMYDHFTGQATYIGVNTGKNGLGMIALILGFAAVWRLLEAVKISDRSRKKKQLFVHGAVLGMTLWLLYMAHSATAVGCALIGSGLIWLTGFRRHKVRPMVLHIIVITIVCICVYGIVIDSSVGLVQTMGKDANLTDRSLLWADLVKADINPLIGAGFESFWLGQRLEALGQKYWWQPNQAHNGYLELYLNLGWAGLLLQTLLIVWGYRNISRSMQERDELARLKLALFVITLVFNLTEATFKVISPMWIIFLLVIAIVPKRQRHEPCDTKSNHESLSGFTCPIEPRMTNHL